MPWAKQRRFTRVPFHLPAWLEHGGRRTECLLLDVSLKGALVEVRDGPIPPVGCPCSISFELLAGTGARVRMDGDVAHQSGTRLGVRCDEVDLESMEHLRRILEVNVGDEGTVLRELGELVAERDWEGRN
jgi:hypothetical protein